MSTLSDEVLELYESFGLKDLERDMIRVIGRVIENTYLDTEGYHQENRAKACGQLRFFNIREGVRALFSKHSRMEYDVSNIGGGSLARGILPEQFELCVCKSKQGEETPRQQPKYNQYVQETIVPPKQKTLPPLSMDVSKAERNLKGVVVYDVQDQDPTEIDFCTLGFPSRDNMIFVEKLDLLERHRDVYQEIKGAKPKEQTPPSDESIRLKDDSDAEKGQSQ